jgi:flagellar hook-associated protein 2
MTSITSNSSYSASASASSSKGFSGLVSGMNTEEMVTKLLSGTQTKIDNQKAKKQVLEWKQAMYRDVITSFNTFKQNFFSYTSQTNLLSSAFFNIMSATSSSSKIKVSAASGAEAGQMKISNVKLATTHSEKAALKASGNLAAAFDAEKLAALAEGSQLEITLDGVTKKIQLDTAAASAEDFAASLQSAVYKAFGNGLTVESVDDKITFSVSDSRKVSLNGDSEVMAALGIKAGASNKITLSTKLKDVNFATDLSGSDYTFKINGVEIKASADDSINTLISRINSSEAGVKMSYSSLEDKFILTSTTPGRIETTDGSEYKFALENTEGNLLTALFGTDGSQAASGRALTLTNEEGESSQAVGATTLGELGIGGTISVGNTEVVLSESDTLLDLTDKINLALGGSSEDPKAAFDEDAGKIRIMGVAVPMEMLGLDESGKAAMQSLFGTEKVQLAIPAQAQGEGINPSGTVTTVQGKNASLTVNGIAVERNSNSFNLDGVQIDLLAETEAGEEIVTETTRNTEKIVEGIKKFVEEYNSLLDKLNGLINADATYKKYAPLTAAQKAEMSEREIELWEEKAKEGLLRRDENITKALRDMRTALYSKPEGAQYSLYDLGIETGGWTDRGKLVMEEPPTKLLEALANDPKSVEKLFNDATSGLGVQLSNIIDATAKISSGSPGSLVVMAGAKSLSDKNNTIARQMDEIDYLLEKLNATYESEKERYWKQFNTMEQLISQMNTQSAWLASQFSS